MLLSPRSEQTDRMWASGGSVVMQRDLVTDLEVDLASALARGGTGFGRCVDGIPSHVHSLRPRREGPPVGALELPPPSMASKADVVVHQLVPDV